MRGYVAAFASIAFALCPGFARAEESAVSCVASQAEGESSAREGKLLVAGERFAQCARSECAEDVRNKCAERRDEVERLTPTVAFGVRDALGRDLDAVVTIDNRPTPVPIGRATKLDPGLHEVSWSTASLPQGHQKLTVFEGQRGRVVILGPAETAPPERAPPTTTESHGHWPWVLIGAGAFLVSTATVFQLVALREDSDRKSLDLALMHDDFSPSSAAMYEEARQSHRDAATTDQTIAITVGAIGLTAIAAGITWAVVRAQKSPQIAPRVGATSFALVF